jgi:hypothetical protein
MGEQGKRSIEKKLLSSFEILQHHPHPPGQWRHRSLGMRILLPSSEITPLYIYKKIKKRMLQVNM